MRTALRRCRRGFRRRRIERPTARGSTQRRSESLLGRPAKKDGEDTWQLSVGEAAQISVSKTNVVDVGETFEITAGQKFSIKVGETRFQMDKMGTVTVEGAPRRSSRRVRRN
jgi:hypothetical protein